MALYNETYYNADQYNLTADLLALSETLTPTDATITKSITSLRQDSMAEIDTISQNIGPDEIMDMIALTELRTYSMSFPRADSLALVELFAALLDKAALLESISSTDVLVRQALPALFDIVFVEDPNFIIEISNKALSDTVRLADWLSIERTPSVDGWGD